MSPYDPSQPRADVRGLPDFAPPAGCPALVPAAAHPLDPGPAEGGTAQPSSGSWHPGATTPWETAGDVGGEPAPGADAALTPGDGERVARGLVFSLGGVVVGVVLTVVLWQASFVASITSFAMASAAIWLYTRGAGRPPARGASGLIAVIVLGVVACLASLNVADTLTILAAEYPGAPATVTLAAVVGRLTAPAVWEAYTRDVVMYVLFAALGTFGLVRQLGRARRA